jgi:class 3 adenylate cyclase
VWLLHVALPLIALWLLIARPEFDVVWEDHGAHLWLVAGVAAVSLALAARVNEQARTRSDARLFLVSLAFVAASGFLALHAVATPGVLVHELTLGFNLAAPAGLLLASAIAVLSAFEFSPAQAARIVRWQVPARLALVGLLVIGGWASLQPAGTATAEAQHGPLVAFAIAGSLLYGLAAVGYYLIHRRRPAAILLSVITAFVLLAESMVAMAYARNWAASWWEWHLLMLVAFGFVAYSAHIHYQREGTRSGLFNSVALEQTLDEVRREHTAALEELVGAMTRGERNLGQVTARLATQFGITEGQAAVLEQGAAALARERDQARRLEALVDVGLLARVNRAEEDLLQRITELAGDAFGDDQLQLRLLREGTLHPAGDDALASRALADREPAESPSRDRLALPLTVKDRATGVLEISRPDGKFGEHDRSVLRSLASQVSIALENARLYQHLDGLFRSYLAPDVATALIADPEQARLGGALSEVTVLMADLASFTPFSERSEPGEVVSMLNTYYGAIVPCILAEGGTVTQFIGDAVMALFNAPVAQPDHALRAARAALAMQDATAAVAHESWPRFRVGINTGQALVGNIGSETMRHFTAIGDTVNLAARLEGSAESGAVVVSAATRAALGDDVTVKRIGEIIVKGKAERVEAFQVTSVADAR